MSCKHENLVVAMYALEIKRVDRTYTTSAARVRCKDCSEFLCVNEVPGIEQVVEYLKENKNNIKTLYDLSCENFNEMLGIKNEEFGELTHSDYERYLELCTDYENMFNKDLKYEDKALIQYGYVNALLNKGE